MKTAAILVAAGSSRRMGFNKLLAHVAGEPVIVHSVRAFENCGAVDEIVVVCGEDVRAVLAQASFSKLKAMVPGGSERHSSVWAGLQAVGVDVSLVAVHDGARPLITSEQIGKCIDQALCAQAVACARRSTETLKRCDPEGRVTGSIDREGVWIMETPQVVHLALLRSAYDEVLRLGMLVTDEVSALQTLGIPVLVCENDQPNPKVTFPSDLPLIEILHDARNRSRIKE